MFLFDMIFKMESIYDIQYSLIDFVVLLHGVS